MANSNHIDLLKHDVAAWNARRDERPFTPDLRGADLRTADLRRANLAGADLAWSNLDDANLTGADLSGATLMGAFMERACLLGAVVMRTDLSGVDLTDSVLRGARFDKTDCSGVDFSGANARSVKMKAPKGCSGRTDLTGARNLKQMQVDTICGDTGVLLAAGLAHPCHWPDWRPHANSGATHAHVLRRSGDGHPALQ